MMNPPRWSWRDEERGNGAHGSRRDYQASDVPPRSSQLLERTSRRPPPAHAHQVQAVVRAELTHGRATINHRDNYREAYLRHFFHYPFSSLPKDGQVKLVFVALRRNRSFFERDNRNANDILLQCVSKTTYPSFLAYILI